ncbi:putative transcriptional regulatory protein pdtaR [Poriferisphaera corsica]|uniref:Putative transcriptional regulatory protein pdtaR n=1 Tax=Poriferisphaera corsica TaxID=2528020 RepID=A0A517YW69_9BACT|nr:response regulator [Poriferisphaera corsica]QDU34449.1 putative transcriptional regulatory protein pdtaR [Poriferisphaera corsica]
MANFESDKATSRGAALPEVRTVIIAEDEHLLARSLCEELTGLGYEVLGMASNGRKVIDLAREKRPDIALLDLRMPEMTGLEAAKVLYEEMGIPVMIVSAYSDREYVEAAGDLGVIGYLLKPVSADTLRVSMTVAWQRYLEKRKAELECALLEKRLADRKLIERAKGLIMQNLGLSESEAMRRLQKQSRDTRRPMAELAQAVIDAQELMEGVATPRE